MTTSTDCIVRLAIGAVAAAATVAAINVAVDPLQILHAPLLTPMYSREERVQNAGLIYSQNYDTIMLGTSLATHFRPSAIDRSLGGKSIKLAMSGSKSREQALILSAALNEGKAKTVLWELDDFIFIDSPDPETSGTLPAHLYHRGPASILRYVLDPGMTKESIWQLLRLISGLNQVALRLTWAGYLKLSDDDLDTLNAFPNYLRVESHYNFNKALSGYLQYKDPSSRSSLGIEAYNFDALVKNFERDTASVVEAHPDTRFVIYFPPYSMLYYATYRDFAPPSYLETFFKFKCRMIERLSSLSNVSLFDFQDVSAVSHDLNNYSDIAHHSPTIDQQVLDWIRSGEHTVEPSQSLRSVENLREQIKRYSIPALKTVASSANKN